MPTATTKPVQPDKTIEIAGAAPLVWVVSGYRAGEKSQIIALAEALGWPFEIKTLEHRKAAIRTNLFRGSDLSGIDLEHSSPLAAPWPDIVISAGMRNEPVCRWIKQQSGGKTLIVHIGKPWANTRCFDLVVTTPQYRLPQRSNVLHNTLTMHRVSSTRLEEQARALRPRLGGLPMPAIALVVGGNSGPYTLGPRAAAHLGAQASQLAKSRGASLLVSTSSRTHPLASKALREHIDVPLFFYEWKPDDSENPYFALLGLAQEIIVTMDSISMLSEACATGKPVHMFDLDADNLPPQARDFRFSAILYRWLMRWGPDKLSRDISIVHRQLLNHGHANWLGRPANEHNPAPPQDLQRAVLAVKSLVSKQRRSTNA